MHGQDLAGQSAALLIRDKRAEREGNLAEDRDDETLPDELDELEPQDPADPVDPVPHVVDLNSPIAPPSMPASYVPQLDLQGVDDEISSIYSSDSPSSSRGRRPLRGSPSFSRGSSLSCSGTPLSSRASTPLSGPQLLLRSPQKRNYRESVEDDKRATQDNVVYMASRRIDRQIAESTMKRARYEKLTATTVADTEKERLSLEKERLNIEKERIKSQERMLEMKFAREREREVREREREAHERERGVHERQMLEMQLHMKNAHVGDGIIPSTPSCLLSTPRRSIRPIVAPADMYAAGPSTPNVFSQSYQPNTPSRGFGCVDDMYADFFKD